MGTPPRGCLRFAGDVATLLRGHGGLVGLAIVGSGATGDLTPHSDIDLLAVIEHPPPLPHRLGDELAALAVRACPARGMELVVYTRAQVQPPSWPQPYLLNVNAGPGMPRHISTGGDPPHWFLLDLAIARDHAVPVHGPHPRQVVGPPRTADVRDALRASLRWHDQQASGSPDAVLNTCRAWHWLETGRWTSKSEAGRWALHRRPGLPRVAEALARRGRGQAAW